MLSVPLNKMPRGAAPDRERAQVHGLFPALVNTNFMQNSLDAAAPASQARLARNRIFVAKEDTGLPAADLVELLYEGISTDTFYIRAHDGANIVTGDTVIQCPSSLKLTERAQRYIRCIAVIEHVQMNISAQ